MCRPPFHPCARKSGYSPQNETKPQRKRFTSYRKQTSLGRFTTSTGWRLWRMCVDFTDLNKACLKDSYPLSRVNVLVDSTAQHQLLSFIDTFSGYNQIRMDETDQEKTSFITSQGLFCYKVLPFVLKMRVRRIRGS